MLRTTLARIRCPNCLDGKSGALALHEIKKKFGEDILSASLRCNDCESEFPILAGVAILVNDIEQYLCLHAKGISSFVKDDEVPLTYRESFLQAKSEILDSEEDLESERVNALYFMNHYVSAGKTKSNPWWRPKQNFSPEIDRLVKNFWDKGPFAKIAEWTKSAKHQNAIELACGVGGLAQILGKRVNSYLGIDSSFTSIALARHINLGAPYPLSLNSPQDLYNGPLTGKIAAPKPLKNKNIDFVVGEIEAVPAPFGNFDLAIALNTIDVLADPCELPKRQHALLKKNGVAIQSSPYLWHSGVAEQLRSELPKKIKSSSEAVAYLYEQEGFQIFKNIEHIPWLFLEHYRKIGVYSVHLFAARKIN